MRPAELRRILARVRRGTLSPDRAAAAIAEAPFERLEFATLDHQRALRTGFPEVVFGPGKTPKQLVAIVERLSRRNGVVLATRVSEAGRAALAETFPRAEIFERSGAVVVRKAGRSRAKGANRGGTGRVLVLCAGTADLPVAEEALVTARVMGSRAELIADVGV